MLYLRSALLPVTLLITAAAPGPAVQLPLGPVPIMAAPTTAAVGAPNLIEPALGAVLTRTRPEALVAIIIQHPTRVDLSLLAQSGLGPRAQAHAAVQRALRAHYASTMGPFEARLRQLGGSRIIPLWASNSVAVTLPASVVDRLRLDPAVGLIKLDAVIQLQPLTFSQLAPSEWNMAAVKAPQVWNLGYSGQNTVVGVLDTGADPAHQDLTGRWRGGANSWYDPYGQHLTGPYDASGHGTSVTSLIVGGNAGGTDIGVAPGARYIAARVFNDSGAGLTSSIHQAMQWMLNPDANALTADYPDVVNASWNIAGAPGVCNAEFEPDIQAFLASDIAVVFAAGNDGPNAGTSDSPGNNAGAMPVGAVDQSKAVASFSSRGPSTCGVGLFPAVAAPGVSIKVADLTYHGVFANNYATITGTTPATAHVTGAIAVLSGAFPDAHAKDVEGAISASALPLGSVGPNGDTGAGQLDILAAYNLLLQSFRPSPPAHLSSTLLVSVGYAATTHAMTVTTTNALGAKAVMQLAGYGAMAFSARTNQWSITVKAAPEPAVITISAADGARSFSTAPGP